MTRFDDLRPHPMRLVAIVLLLALLAGCSTDRTVGGGGDESNQGFFGRIGSIFKF